MSAKFCIKKNPTSFFNPWLCRMAPGQAMHGRLVYAHLDDIAKGICILQLFPSIESAKTFIKENPDECDGQNVVYEVKTESCKMEMSPT